MQVHEIEELTIEILQESSGKYLLPYQVFKKIKQKDPLLAQTIEPLAKSFLFYGNAPGEGHQ